MERQGIERGAEYLRLRHLLFSVLGAVAILSFVKFLLRTPAVQPPPKNERINDILRSNPPKTKNYRAAIEPKGNFVPTLSRSHLAEFPLVDMTDHGDFLFMVSPPDANYRQYLHRFNGKEETTARLKANERMSMSPSGKLIKRTQISNFFTPRGGNSNNVGVGFPYNETRFIRRSFDDGSMLFVTGNYVNKESVYMLMRHWIEGKSQEYYRTNLPMSIHEKSDKDVIWFSERHEAGTIGRDVLVRMENMKRENVAMPPDYEIVQRVAQTGDMVAGTFGYFGSDQPIRSYVLEGKTWRELPLPKGYALSFVQKVMYGGQILGFVTDALGENMKQVVWKGDSVAILNDLPAWPKFGEVSMVTMATRSGNLHIRNVLNQETGVGENYLLALGP